MEGSSDLLPVLLRLLALFGLGLVVAFMLCAEHAWRYVFLGWIGCVAGYAGLFAVAVHVGVRSEVLGEAISLLLPAGLLGAALGLIAGLIWYQDF